jgi:hypothetical protein
MWVFVLAAVTGCGKKRTDDRRPDAERTDGGANPGTKTPPKQPAPSTVDTAPDTSGFSTTDPVAALAWLSTEFDRIEKRDPRDPRYAGKMTVPLHEEMERALIGKQVRWPMKVNVVFQKDQMINLDAVLLRVVASGEREPRSLNVGGPPGDHAHELPAKEPRDWLQTVRPMDRVLVVGTVSNVHRSDWFQPGVKGFSNRHWQIGFSPGWAEPLPGGR